MEKRGYIEEGWTPDDGEDAEKTARHNQDPETREQTLQRLDDDVRLRLAQRVEKRIN